jgi:hypothetical protein
MAHYVSRTVEHGAGRYLLETRAPDIEGLTGWHYRISRVADFGQPVELHHGWYNAPLGNPALADEDLAQLGLFIAQLWLERHAVPA